MDQASPQNSTSIKFDTVHLFKDQCLGIGSYGVVCKAKCDDLLCAAKVIHAALLDRMAYPSVPGNREHRLPIRRFEQECELMSAIRHPNIVQYLGVHRDQDTGRPVLLMELMDCSLTHFLETSPQPIPYHIQVNIGNDIVLALSFLHSNGIVHRDLSSNNVLLIGNIRAKVTDFGMASLSDLNPQAAHPTFTICPGTDVYMPPEAIKEKPTYTEKLDCFSFGVIAVQILTQQFPKPGERQKAIEIDQPGLPSKVYVPVSEIERRQTQISELDQSHPLLPIALECLKDNDIERPSARQLCKRILNLKESPNYSESTRATQQMDQDNTDKEDKQISELRRQLQIQADEIQQLKLQKVDQPKSHDNHPQHYHNTLVKYYRLQSCYQNPGSEQDRVQVPVWIASDCSKWVQLLEKAMSEVNTAAPGVHMFLIQEKSMAKVHVLSSDSTDAHTEGNILIAKSAEIYLGIAAMSKSSVATKKRTITCELLHSLGFHPDCNNTNNPVIHGLTCNDPFSIHKYEEDESTTLWKHDPSQNTTLSELDKVCLNLLYCPCKGPHYKPECSPRTGLVYCGQPIMKSHNHPDKRYTTDGSCGPVDGPNCPACRTIKTTKVDEILQTGKWQGWSGRFYCGLNFGVPNGRGVYLTHNRHCGPDNSEPCPNCKQLTSP